MADLAVLRGGRLSLRMHLVPLTLRGLWHILHVRQEVVHELVDGCALLGTLAF